MTTVVMRRLCTLQKFTRPTACALGVFTNSLKQVLTVAGQIKIYRCSDSLRWYAKHVGKVFTLIRNYRDGYLVQDPDGYTNIVLHQDAEIMTDEQDSQ